jgi:type IV secretion system protein VirB1
MMLALATLAAYLQTCAPSVAPDTMRAVVSVESHGYIYAINDNTSRRTYCVPGAAVFPCDRDQAAALAERAVRSRHSVDVGIAQVNSGNFRAYGVSATQMLDPCENLRIGRKYSPLRTVILQSILPTNAQRFGMR